MHYLLHCTNSYEEKTKSGSIPEQGVDLLSGYPEFSANKAQMPECISPRLANDIGGKWQQFSSWRFQ